MIQSLQRAFSILELLDRDTSGSEGLGPQEIANHVGLKFPTTHNFLKSLVELGYLERVPDAARYRIAGKLIHLGATRSRVQMLRQCGEAEIRRLWTQFRETVSLDLETNLMREGICVAESNRELRVVQRQRHGEFYPYPVGRVLLSGMSPDRLQAFVDQNGFPKDKWNGIDTRHTLNQALKIIRHDQVEVKRNLQIGAAAIAVPIEGLDESLNAALCLVLPLVRLDDAKCAEIVGALHESAEAIAQRVREM